MQVQEQQNKYKISTEQRHIQYTVEEQCRAGALRNKSFKNV